jgi:hypothetical protein
MAGLLRVCYVVSMRVKDERQLDKELAAAMRSKGGYVNLRAGLHAVQTQHGGTYIPLACQEGTGLDVSTTRLSNNGSTVQAVTDGN